MYRKPFTLSATLLVATLLSPLPIAAKTPHRGSSGNGVNNSSTAWNLLGRSVPRSVSSATKKVNMTRQIVCLNQDVENSLPSPNLLLTGTCDSGVYLHLFQFTSSSAPVKVTLTNLVGFVLDPVFNNYGAMLCDNSDPVFGNTYELCTNDPTGVNIPDIPVTVAQNKTSITFAVPNFPKYPPGIDNQGTGLTLYIITQQSSPLPIQLPLVLIQ